jgi:hypothetical protein
VHQEQVDVVQSQALQALLQTLGSASVVCAPQLGSDEDILTLDTGGECLLETCTNLILVGVAVGAINMLVSILKSV